MTFHLCLECGQDVYDDDERCPYCQKPQTPAVDRTY